MGKNRNKYTQNRPATAAANTGPAAPQPSVQTPPRPTPEQQQQVEELVAAAPPLPEGKEVPPPVEGVPLERLIKEARYAEHCYLAAKRGCEDLQKELARKRDELGSGRVELERDRADLNKQREELAASEQLLRAELVERERKLGEGIAAREKLVMDKEQQLASREANAEQGFLDERKRILGPLAEQAAALRRERDELAAALLKRRSEAEAEWRERLAERELAWRREDERRSQEAAEVRERLTRELAAERRRRFDEMELEIQRCQAALSAKLAQREQEHRAVMDHERRALEAEQDTLREQQKKLRMDRIQVDADRELVNEDRGALEQRIHQRAVSAITEVEHERDEAREQLSVAARMRDEYFSRLQKREELDRRFGGLRPEEVLDRMNALEQRCDSLSAELQRRLGEKAQERLAELERESSRWREDEMVLRAELAEARQRIDKMRVQAVSLETERSHREALEANKKLLEEALKTLRAEVDRYTQADEKQNPLAVLCDLDADEALSSPVRTVPPIGGGVPSLPQFVEDLRHRIAGALEGRTLYYSLADLRCFLGGLAMSRLHLYQGISGTGKTSLPRAAAQALGAGCEVIEVQAGWRDRQDLVGYYNAFHRHFYATNFLQALYRAGTPAYADRLFLIVLDEINLSRTEQFFADFLSALEQPPASRRLTLLSDPLPDPPRLFKEGRHLPIPPNVWFIGTANHDETTTDFADKTYDRAHVMELPRQREAFEAKRCGTRPAISFQALEQLFKEAAQQHADATQRALSFLKKSEFPAYLDHRFRVGWGNRLERDVECFVPVVVGAGGSPSEAMDHLLATKVLRKLRDRHDVRIKSIEDLRDLLKKEWAAALGGEPTRCLALLERERRAKSDEEAA